jgi:hypothetical protein
MHHQVAAHPAAVAVEEIYLCAFERNRGVFSLIEKIAGQKVLVSFFYPCIHACNVNFNLH